ncbi:MAG: response regulator [Lachnospiraceae bacterium]|nr:response regulator [Lachnospiraceae bacterium]
MKNMIKDVKTKIINGFDTFQTRLSVRSEVDRKMFYDVSQMASTFHSRHPRIWGILRSLIAISMVAASTIMLFRADDGFFEMSVNLGSVKLTFVNGPLIFLSAIGGFIPALVSFTSLFAVQLFTNTSMAYSSFIFLIDIALAHQMAKRSCFRSFRKTLFTIPVFALIVGDVWFLVNDIMYAHGFMHLSGARLIMAFVGSLPECAAAALFAYGWYKILPHDVRRLFRFGDYDMTRNIHTIREAKRAGRTWISTKISTIITVEALILTVCAALFSNMLMSEMGEQIFKDINRGEVTLTMPDMPAEGSAVNGSDQLQDAEVETEASAQPPSFHQRMILNDHGLAYALRLIMMLFNLTVPMASFANFYAQQTIARPLMRMAFGISKFNKASDEEKPEAAKDFHKLDVASKDEIQDLYQNMDAMALDVIAYREHLQKEQRMQEDLRVAEKASQAKSDFLSSMSHEIRTPINAVLGLDEMILREAEDESVLQYALDIQNAGHSLLSLVNDILDFSKIEAGKMEIIPVEYDLASTINDLVNMIAVRAENKGLSLVAEVNPDIPHVLYGDEIRVKQIVTNILTNAVKYTETGTVTMYVDYEKKNDDEIGLFFRVVDTGIGMKEEDIKKLYSPFERIEEKRNRTIEGTGLGMSIVKQLLDKMDSELVVKSVYGEGSDFSFTVAQKVVKWEPIGDFSKTYKENLKNRQKYKESFKAPEAQILITDDTRMNLTVVVALLKKTEIRIDTAGSGRETLSLVKKKKYDLIFLDHMMPEMDGIETLHNMQEMEDNINKDTPVIVLTANAIAGAREGYIKEGFSDYLSKPVDGKKLEKMLIEYLPKEKVTIVDSAGEEEEGAGASEEADLSIEGIDMKEGEKNCGSRDVLLSVMKEYEEAADEKLNKIEQYYKAEDIKNYTIEVHALKSSSRMIGAIDLSEKAAYLEKCGNENNVEEIREKTPELLEILKDVKEKLYSTFEHEDEGEKPEISEEELLSAFGTVKELVEAFDFDSADDVIGMVDAYKIPDEYADKYERVKAAVRKVDQAELLSIL